MEANMEPFRVSEPPDGEEEEEEDDASSTISDILRSIDDIEPAVSVNRPKLMTAREFRTALGLTFGAMLTVSALLSIAKRRRGGGSHCAHTLQPDEVFLFMFASVVYARFAGKRTA
jgi:hypothetical protein